VGVDRLIRILAEMQTDPDLAEQIGPSTDIINEIGLDSLQMINLALRVEDEFQITLDFETFDLDTLLSVESFWRFIESMMAWRTTLHDAPALDA
jgi:acyl carrier protein